jgi:tungstate transport system substrate-binding protein
MRMTFLNRSAVLGLALAGAFAAAGFSPNTDTKTIVVASTTSTEQSGLFGHILPIFKAKTGIEVKVIAQGTGQALDTGRRGDADVVFVHAAADEKKFVEEGFGVQRFPVMYNDFVIVGPKSDPAGVKGQPSAPEALKAIAAKAAVFVSRGDNSGTHKAELALWKQAGAEPKGQPWYREAGSGMGPTLNISAQLPGYTLTDRGTWISFKNRGDLDIVVERDKKLFNQYGVILVNPAKHPAVKAQEGQAFVDWLVSEEGQSAIASFKIDGQQLFYPNAKSGA